MGINLAIGLVFILFFPKFFLACVAAIVAFFFRSTIMIIFGRPIHRKHHRKIVISVLCGVQIILILILGVYLW